MSKLIKSKTKTVFSARVDPQSFIDDGVRAFTNQTAYLDAVRVNKQAGVNVEDEFVARIIGFVVCSESTVGVADSVQRVGKREP